MVSQWSKTGATVECQFIHYGVLKSDKVSELLKDPMKVFVIRFFDNSARSLETHVMWNDLVNKIKGDNLFRAVVTYQINCHEEPEFCKEQKIREMPDILAFRNRKVFSYFTQKFDVSEADDDTLFEFVDDLAEINPLRKHVLPPVTDVSICCDALLVSGEDIRGRGDGVYRKENITKFGHVHYTQEDGAREIFFEQNDFNIGLPYSGEESRVNIRSETLMKLIYEDLGRSPCPNELEFWKYRSTDFDAWQYDRNIQIQCTTTEDLLLISNIKEHTPDESLDITNVTLTPQLADETLPDETLTNETLPDNCASYINVQGAMLPIGRGGGDFYKITERYNGFATYFHETEPATENRTAIGYYIYFRQYEDFRGWVIGERTVFNSSSNRASLYQRDGGYRLFARIRSPNLDDSAFIEKCPCRLREEDYWSLRLPSSSNWVPRVEEGWYMDFGGNTNFDISISCASSLVDQFQDEIDTLLSVSRRAADPPKTKTLATGQTVPIDYNGPTPPPVMKFEMQDALFMQAQQKLRELGASVSARMDDFDASFDADTQSLVQRADKDLAYLKKRIPEMKIDMDPGSAVGVSGEFLQPAPWTMSSRAASKTKDDWGGDIGGSKTPVLQSTNLGNMMINDCYRQGSFVDHRGQSTFHAKADIGQAKVQTSFVDQNFMNRNKDYLYDENTFERQSVGSDTSCPIADSIINACKNIIDAAQYIGVTYDITGGYSTKGYRSQIVIMWCINRRKFANNRFDVPDFMHVQGVYETSMETKAFNSLTEWADHKSRKANTQNGKAAFSEDTRKFDKQEAESLSVDIGVSFKAPVAQVEASVKVDKERSHNEFDNSFHRDSEIDKDMDIETNKSKNKKKTNTLIAELTIKVSRYQAYLDEISPATITSEFLDDFKILPTTYYRPDSPALFQDFIDRWGTHIVKSAQFGGILTFTRTATDDGTVDLNDFHKETQKEFEKMSANSAAKQTQDTQSLKVDARASGSGNDPKSGVSGSGSASVGIDEKSSSLDGESQLDSNAEVNNSESGVKNVDQDQKQTSLESTYIRAEGGSQKIAAMIGDVYSPNFKSTLKKWLESIPEYPKPFDWSFVPLPEVLTHLVKSFLDPVCVEQCASTSIDLHDDKDLNEDSGDFCIKEQINSFPCKDPEVYGWDKCHKQCEHDLPTCQLKEKLKKPCSSLKLEEEKWRRRVSALSTAIEIYVSNKEKTGRGLIQEQNIMITRGAPLCTVAYNGKSEEVEEGDSISRDLAQTRTVDDWDTIAVHPIMIRFDLPPAIEITTRIRFKYRIFGRTFFWTLKTGEDEPLLNIGSNERFFLRFDGFHRKWYTQEDPDELANLPMLDSAQYLANQLKSKEVTSNGVGMHIG